jgi:hypothetical protein
VDLLEESEPLFRAVESPRYSRTVERSVLTKGVRPRLGHEPPDTLIRAVIAAIDAYEGATGLLQQAFDGLLWSIQQRTGRARPNDVLNDARVRRHLESTFGRLGSTATSLERATAGLRGEPAVDEAQIVEPLVRLREDVVQAGTSISDMVETVWRRHEAVQRAKKKAAWIEREEFWTLMPGQNRFGGDTPPRWVDAYLHPMKIKNAYSLLKDLGRVTVEAHDGED